MIHHREARPPWTTIAMQRRNRELYLILAFGRQDREVWGSSLGPTIVIHEGQRAEPRDHEDPICFMCGETAQWVDGYGRCQECRASL